MVFLWKNLLLVATAEMSSGVHVLNNTQTLTIAMKQKQKLNILVVSTITSILCNLKVHETTTNLPWQVCHSRCLLDYDKECKRVFEIFWNINWSLQRKSEATIQLAVVEKEGLCI